MLSMPSMRWYIFKSRFHNQIGNINHCSNILRGCLMWLYHLALSVVSYISRESCFLFPLLLCSLRYVQIIENVTARSSRLFVYILQYLIIIIMRTNRKAWTYTILLRYILPSVSLRLRPSSQLSVCILWDCVFSANLFLHWRLCWYLYFILSSWYGSYDLLIIIYD